MNKNLVNQDYWDNNYQDLTFFKVPDESVIKQWVNKYIPDSDGDCIEIGTFPGGYLEMFGQKGYRLNGIDLTPRVKEEEAGWLKSLGHKVGEFEQIDFLKFKPNRKYQVVCSFGFIEHFSDYLGILKKQADMVTTGGYLVVEVPNFRGFVQRFLHSFLDRENYERHNIKSMKTSEWVELLEASGFEIVTQGPLGGFDFWHDKQERTARQEKYLGKVMKKLPKWKVRYRRPTNLYSPYLGVIARRKTPFIDK